MSGNGCYELGVMRQTRKMRLEDEGVKEITARESRTGECFLGDLVLTGRCLDEGTRYASFGCGY
jgi:hypothetical protein